MRLEHIKRNHEYLVMLGLENATSTTTVPQKKRAAPVVKREPTQPTRRSARNKGEKPEYTGHSARLLQVRYALSKCPDIVDHANKPEGEKIDQFGLQLDNIIGQAAKRSRQQSKRVKKDPGES